MNIKEYISSGILEAYVLGDLSEQEMAEVQKNIAQYPELKAELARVEEVQEKLLMAAAIEPRAAVKAAIFEQVGNKAKVVAMDSGNVNVWRYAVAASVTVALIAGYLAYDYRTKWKATCGLSAGVRRC